MTKKLCFKRSWLLRTLSFTYVWVKFNFVSTVKTVSFKVRWDKDQSPKEKWPREHAQPFKQFGKGQIWQKNKIVILHFFMVWTITWFWDEIRHGKTKVSSTLRTRGKTNSNICCFVYFCHHLRSKALPSKSLTFSKRTMLNHPRSSRIRDFFAA
jgi:hypothetical protein